MDGYPILVKEFEGLLWHVIDPFLINGGTPRQRYNNGLQWFIKRTWLEPGGLLVDHKEMTAGRLELNAVALWAVLSEEPVNQAPNEEADQPGNVGEGKGSRCPGEEGNWCVW